MAGRMILNLDDIIEQNNEIEVSELNGEKVMMDLENGKYFSLNELGSKIWDLIERPIKIGDLLPKLLEDYEVTREECEDNVIKFLEVLSYEEVINVI